MFVSPTPLLRLYPPCPLLVLQESKEGDLLGDSTVRFAVRRGTSVGTPARPPRRPSRSTSGANGYNVERWVGVHGWLAADPFSLLFVVLFFALHFLFPALSCPVVFPTCAEECSPVTRRPLAVAVRPAVLRTPSSYSMSLSFPRNPTPHFKLAIHHSTPDTNDPIPPSYFFATYSTPFPVSSATQTQRIMTMARL